jgi:multidrug efflux pump subunit AcrA (membrane-fusion protein)
MLKRIKSCLLFCLVAGIVALALSCNHVKGISENAVEVKTPVTLAPVTFKPVTSTVNLPAITMFMNKSIIRATTTGTIEKILISQGDLITSDQLLFTIKTREAMAMKNSNGSDTSLSFKGLINITSHNGGVVNSISYRRGDYVQEGDEMAVIAEQNSLVFILEVPFELNSYVEQNQKCTILLPDKKQVEGKITEKLSEMEIQSQTVRYIVKPSSTGVLPANLIASITLIKSKNENALILPKKAVLSNETQTEFWVMKLINDTTAIKVVVEKGFENYDEVEITKPEFIKSDRIILTGNYGLADTARVAIIQE